METAFDEGGFWEKVKNYAQSAGKEVIENSLRLYYAAQQPETPIWAKAVIYGAIGYFVMPLDAIPDAVPVAGYSDDLGALAAAMGMVAMHITNDVKAMAAMKMKDWFSQENNSLRDSA